MKNLDFSKEEDRQSFYCSKEWRALRELLLSQKPLCVKCLSNGVITPAEEIDHILPLRFYPDERFNSQNLQPLCKPCHSEKTYQETLAKRKLNLYKPLWKKA